MRDKLFALLSSDEAKKSQIAQVNAQMDQIGIGHKLTGRKYIVEYILMKMDGHMTGISAIAKMYGKTDASVERAMQYAINAAWRIGNIGDLKQIYTARISSEKGVPTLTEFICYYANKLKNAY